MDEKVKNIRFGFTMSDPETGEEQFFGGGIYTKMPYGIVMNVMEPIAAALVNEWNNKMMAFGAEKYRADTKGGK